MARNELSQTTRKRQNFLPSVLKFILKSGVIEKANILLSFFPNLLKLKKYLRNEK